MIKYYTSSLNIDCFFAAVDDVVVAMWHESFWRDRCIYRPLRDHYKLIEWTKKEFDPSTIADMEEFEYVRDNKTEMPREEEKKEIFRLLNKMK
jgi:hypothetical protein